QNQNAENQDTLQAPNISDTGSPKPSYSKQISVDGAEYKISANNVADLPPNNADEQNKVDQFGENAAKDSLPQVVLPPPQKAQSSTPNSSLKNSKVSLGQVPPLKVPTLTPETPQNKTSERSINNNPEPIPSPSKKLPEGVVAVQNLPVEENEPDTNLVNNRYRNVAEDAKEKEKSAGDKIIMDAQDKENGANEIFDVGGGFNEDPNIGGKQEEQKNRIDVEYDHFQQNDPNIDENEDDDADYGNHIPKEVAIRN
ncbi:hypothetical protein AMK59_7649, partial [Oryctes borbonicus]